MIEPGCNEESKLIKLAGKILEVVFFFGRGLVHEPGTSVIL